MCSKLVTISASLALLAPSLARAQDTALPPAPVAPPALAPPPALPPPPPVYVYTEAPEPKRAPRYALWIGARAGLLTFGGSFYEYQLPNERPQLETTGNIVRPGVSVEVDAGARLGKRYIPYLFLEHGFMGAGRLFEGTGTRVASDYFGIGFRTTFGDVDDIGFVTDLALGFRSIRATNDTQSWRMQTLELFRFGLGAEIRLSKRFVLSPMLTVSTGSMSDTDGRISYKPGSAISGPLFHDGESVGSSRVYIVAGVGCGAHFDLFGR